MSCGRVTQEITLTVPATGTETVPAKISLTPTVVVRPDIPPPPGLVFLQKCSAQCSSTLWHIDKDSNLWQIPFDGHHLAISHDHHFIAYENNRDIWLLDLRGSERRNLTNTPDCQERDPAWSPDDRKIVFWGCGFNQRDDLYIFDLATEEKVNLTNTPRIQETCIERYPTRCLTGWWKQYPHLIFFGFSDFQGIRESPLPGQCHAMMGKCLYFPAMISADGGNYKILDRNSGLISPPSLSPSGRFLACDGGHLYDLDTGQIITLLPTDYGASLSLASIPINADGPELIRPVWSPDGRQIAWVAHVGREGETGVVIFDLEVHEAKVIYSYAPGDYIGGSLLPSQRWPDIVAVWSPNGQWLAFETVEEKTGQPSDMQVNTFVYTREGVQLSRWHLGGSLPVWSPDSKWLAINNFDPGSGTGSILLVEIENLQVKAVNIGRDLEIIDWLPE